MEVSIDYDSPNFGNEARRLISAGEAFSFEIRGTAYEHLKPYLTEGGIAEPTDRFATLPKLQRLGMVMVLAEVHERRIGVEEGNDKLAFRVGPTTDSGE